MAESNEYVTYSMLNYAKEEEARLVSFSVAVYPSSKQSASQVRIC